MLPKKVKEKPSAVSTVSQSKVLPPPPDIIADVFPSKGPKAPLEPVFPPQASKPRTKEDIMGYSDTDSEDSIDIGDIHPDIKLLPETVDELRERFNELYAEFMCKGKHEHRNELVSILDELLRQSAITKDEYT